MNFRNRVTKLEELKQRSHIPFNPEVDDPGRWLRRRLKVGLKIGSRVTKWNPEDGSPEDYVSKKMAEQ